MDRLIKFKIVEWDSESNLKYNFLRYISKFLGLLRSTQDSDTPYVAVIAVLVVVIVVLVTALAVNVVILRYIPIIESLNPYFTCFYINYLLISSQWLYVFFKIIYIISLKGSRCYGFKKHTIYCVAIFYMLSHVTIF